MKKIRTIKYNKFFMNSFSWLLDWRRSLLSFMHAERNETQSVLLSRLGQYLVSDVTVRPPNIDGEFRVSPKSHLLRGILSNGAYEPEIVALFKKQLSADKDVIDIGANIGFYTVLSAKNMQAGRVFAIEPVKSAYDRLVQNINKNGVDQVVTTIRCFVSDERGTTVMHTIPGMEEYSSASRMNISGHLLQTPAIEEQVDCLTLDEIISKHQINPGLVKIDVEGAECKVLRGAKRCLDTYGPALIVECSDNLLKGMGASSFELISYLEALGYCPLNPHTEERISVRTGIEDNILFMKR